ncbi:hypothetical protein CLOM_g1854 [Closterium sp. NIES-68]|nr:hypothetical protein CLOM_g23547 [Closterium sp. NIES-68]GJP42268.1 hypothetical protein CLOM_g1854 [Closterium sp. NIES-68]GJP71534.1 hypothetical protein CLOP_g2360 [Closterium sp. NIES-67]GJP83474.1 hypothetical protein CLOP_g13620 [Closterium sp. NIES-67]
MAMFRFRSIHAIVLVVFTILALATASEALEGASRRSLAVKKLQCPSGAGICPYRSLTTCSQASIYCSGACCINNVEYPCCGGSMCCRAGGCMRKKNGSYACCPIGTKACGIGKCCPST